MDRIEDSLLRIETETEGLRPPGEIIIGDSKSTDAAKQLQHFFVREQARRVSRMLERADDRLAREATGRGGVRRSSRAVPAVSGKSKRQLSKFDTTPVIDDALLGQNVYRFLQDSASTSIPYGDHVGDYLQDLIREASLLDAINAMLPSERGAEKTWLTIASLDERGRAACIRLRDLYRSLFEREFGCTTSLPDSSQTARLRETVGPHGHFESLSLDGPLASVLAPLESGTHLFVSADEGYTPLVVSSHTGIGSVSNDGLPPVLRIYSDPGATFDVRSRLLARGPLGKAELRAFILSALPPPRELNTIAARTV